MNRRLYEENVNVNTANAQDVNSTEVKTTPKTTPKTQTTAKATSTVKASVPFSNEDLLSYFGDGNIIQTIKARKTPVTKISLNSKGTVTLSPEEAKEKVETVTPDKVETAQEARDNDRGYSDATYTEVKESQVFSDPQILHVLESLNITLPSFMKLSEAVTNLNALFKPEITKYLNERNINIKFIYKDTSSGRIIADDGNGKKYFVDDIFKYINSTVTQDWEVYDPITNEDVANIKGQLSSFLKSYKMPLNTTLKLKNGMAGNFQATFTLGRIIKATLKESMIKKFKEDTANSGKVSIEMTPEQYKKYLYGDKKVTTPSMEAEFNCCIFLNKENKTNDYADESVISLIQKNLCGELNKQKVKLKYKKDNSELIYNVTFEIGDEQNTRVIKDKNVVVFTLKLIKAQSQASKGSKVLKAIGKGLGTAINTLATASGAVVQANNSSRNSTPVQL